MVTLLVNDLFVPTSNRQISVLFVSELYPYLLLMTSSFLKLSLPFSHSFSLTPDTLIFLLALLTPIWSSPSVNTSV